MNVNLGGEMVSVLDERPVIRIIMVGSPAVVAEIELWSQQHEIDSMMTAIDPEELKSMGVKVGPQLQLILLCETDPVDDRGRSQHDLVLEKLKEYELN